MYYALINSTEISIVSMLGTYIACIFALYL